MTPNDVGARIEWLYTEMGLKQAHFARYLGKQPHQVSTWVKRGNIDTKNVALIASKTNATMDWILLGKGDPPKPPKLDFAKLEAARESRVEVDVLSSLLDYFTAADVSPEHRLALRERSKMLVAGDGVPDWAEEHRKLMVRPGKVSRGPEPEELPVREGLKPFGVKRKA